MNVDAIGGGGEVSPKPKSQIKEDMLSTVYSVDSSLWYQSLPYGFAYTKKGDDQSDSFYYWLPINPQNLTITSSFATNIVNTLYSVVEEHSEVRWYEIAIQGTTGMAPRYHLAKQDITKIIPSKSRESYGDDPSSFLESAEVLSLLGSLGDVALHMKQQFETLTSDPEVSSGVKNEASGYKAFHDFYRFLLMYKKEVSDATNDKELKIHPLRFMNYKDGLCWNVIPVSFVMNRSAESPMLYNYQIVMKGYNMKMISEDDNVPTTESEKSFGLAGYGNSLIDNTKFAYFFNKTMAGKNLVLGGLLMLGGAGNVFKL